MQMIPLDLNSICGHGRSGNVYRLTFNNQPIAVKYCIDSKLFDEMDNEVRFLNELHDCEFVPELLKTYKRNGAYVVITEFIDGEHVPLHKVPLSKVAEYEQALRAIHAHGILHGDIKDENFIMTKDKVYVLDFGFSRKATQSELDDEYNSLRMMMGIPPLTDSDLDESHLPGVSLASLNSDYRVMIQT